MKFETKYKLMLLKSYFDKGMSLTSYAKYFIAFFALASQKIQLTIIIGILYGIFSFFLGWFWYTYGFMKTEIEVNNRYNKFVNEMRNKIKKKRFK